LEAVEVVSVSRMGEAIQEGPVRIPGDSECHEKKNIINSFRQTRLKLICPLIGFSKSWALYKNPHLNNPDLKKACRPIWNGNNKGYDDFEIKMKV
jgi:hypothetical protein